MVRYSILSFALSLCLSACMHNMVSPPSGPGTNRGEELFQLKCGYCHSTSGWAIIGPGMKGINKKTTREWLRKFIFDPQNTWEKDEGYTKVLKKKIGETDTAKTTMKYYGDLAPTQKETDAIVEYIWSL